MGIQQYRPRRNISTVPTRGEEPVGDPRAALEDFPHTEMVDHMLPQVLLRNEFAINVDRVGMTFFQEIRSGRRCSCFTIETDPTEDCQVCFGSGKAGGFSKRGTRLEIFDWSRENSLINMVPNFNTRPVTFELSPDAISGEIHFETEVLNNTTTVDALQSVWFLPAPEQSTTEVEIKKASESTFAKLDTDSLQSRLDTTDKLDIRIKMTRAHISVDTPIFSHTLFRYELIDTIMVFGDWPKLEHSSTLAEAGFVDTIIAPQIQLDNTLKNITSDDFFIRLSDNKRWKVTNAEPYRPGNVLVGWQVSLRLIQDRLEANYVNVPA